MVSDGLKLFEYNEANQLKRVKLASNSATLAEYMYDYNGNRMVKKNYNNGVLANTVYSWSDSFETKVIEGGATETTVYYFANKELVAKKKNDGSIQYIHTDHLGSTSVVKNSGGSLVESTSYDPWGEVLVGGTQSKFGYTGQEKDSETGLNYYDSRYYSSDIRRFAQPDSLIPNIYNPQDLNRYSYANNNPLKYTDPTGHVGEILKYNQALNQYYKKPSAITYNNVLNTAASIQKQSGNTTNSSGSNNSGSSGSGAVVASISQNKAAGKLYETQALEANGYVKNNNVVKGYGTKNIIPDIDAWDVGDAKRVQYLTKTRQMATLLDYAEQTERKCVIICPIETKLSRPMQEGLESLGKEGVNWEVIRYGSLKGAQVVESAVSKAFIPLDFIVPSIIYPNYNVSGTIY